MPAAFNAFLISLAMGSPGTEFASPNFVVHAPDAKIAHQVAEAAEHFRKKLAVQWYGHEIPTWGSRCDISVVVGPNLGAGGSTRFKFDRGEVYDWNMEVQGSLERILDSVIPHEVNHTILACYFRRKVPRWADEGAATVVEHISEKSRSFQLAEKLVNQGRRIPLRVLLNMTQYPRDSNQILAMYAQGYSLTEFLIQQGGRQHFLKFLNDAHHQGWERAIATFYGSRNIEQLDQKWSGWVLAGSPRLDLPPGQLLAETRPETPASVVSIVRSQGPEAEASPQTPISRQEPASLLSRVGQFTRILNAPDPRAGSTTSGTEDLRVAATSSPQRFPVPNPRDIASRATASSTRSVPNFVPASQPLQPLALTKIVDRKTIPPAVPASPLPSVLRSRRSAGDLTGRTAGGLRETRLRTAAPEKKTATSFLNWSQFPSRVR